MADPMEIKTLPIENVTLNQLSELQNLLHECLLCSKDEDTIELLRKCALFVENSAITTITQPLVLLLEKICDYAIVPPFVNRDYFSYEKSDFGSYSETTPYVLIFFNSFFHNFKTNCDTSSTEENLCMLAKLIFKLVIVVGGNVNCPLWSSNECAKLSSQLMDTLMSTLKCETTCDLLNLKACYLVDTNEKETLVASFVSFSNEHLSSANWQKNPFLSESFSWIIEQITLPYLSSYINQVMAISLSFLDDFQEVNKIRGLRCLMHLISNTSKEELCWYNRADVIYSSLKHQMYVKDASVLQKLFPCLFTILRILDKSVDLKYHHDLLDELIRDSLSENLLILRRLYISNVCSLIKQVGVSCICHLSRLLKIVEQFLETEDGEDELARLGALQLLRNVILLAWPRISKHSKLILKVVLKLLVDINGKYYYDGKETCAQSQMNDLALDCLRLLIKVCPDTVICLQHRDMAKGLHHVANILERLKIDTFPTDMT
uniref:TELO2-interacting protein 2 n=1 Tax=Biomphalaria glabrata TaxID=6526 RepID=A0A2C9M2N0_BIOGL